jgi:enolase
MSGTIASVIGRRVWDSRGRPTVEAEIVLDSGARGRAIAPAGASTGSGEALDLRDGSERFGGFDVTRALDNVNGEIGRILTGLAADDQAAVDAALIAADGTANKRRLGGNAIVAASMAVAHAAANNAGKPLWSYLAGGAEVSIPLPQIQILGGGAHAGRRVDVQDFLIMCPTAKDFGEALERSAEVYRAAGELMAADGRRMGVADEGGWWPAFATNEEALDYLVRAIERAGYAPGGEVSIALDIAASEFWRDGRYWLGLEARELDTDGLAEMLMRWTERYPILSVEDPFAEHDLRGFELFTAAVGKKLQVVGDDLFVTDAARISGGASLANCVLIKPNQVGTLTETLAAIAAARAHGMAAIISARSGESEDVTIAHLAVGWNASQLKVGSMTRGERTAKWNEILRIEERLGGKAGYAGAAALGFR